MDTSTERQKFESFKFGGATTQRPNSLQHHKSTHSRSGSRSSISSSARRPLSLSNDLDSFKFGGTPATDVTTPGNTSASHVRLNSHHRRRSSVSTRRESADLMGVALPDLPPAKTEESDRDSIRRRALWALEGKENTSFAKVEIPELTSFDAGSFSFGSKVSCPSSAPSSHTINKRESQSLFINMSKDALGTLIEEDEEESEDHPATSTSSRKEVDLPSPSLPLFSTTMDDSSSENPFPPIRPRPASLQLRPLSLISGASVAAAARSLPTPTLTPTMSPLASAGAATSSPPASAPFYFPRAPKGLRSLSLSASINRPPDSSPPTTLSNRRQSLILASPVSSQVSPARRPSLSLETDSSASPVSPPRRSSIQYRKTISQDSTTNGGDDSAGLPTPDTTPITSRTNSVVDEPVALTTSEQQFLFKSHQTLLSRITDLERALRMRTPDLGSRRSGSSSSNGSIGSSSSEILMRREPSSEMTQLISELTDERDELRRDIVGWRTRVADLEKQILILNGRVEAERLESWSNWNKLSKIDEENKRLQHFFDGKNEDIDRLSREVLRFRDLYSNEQMRRDEAEDEVYRLRQLLAEEKTRTSPRASIIPVDYVADEDFPNQHLEAEEEEDALAGYEDEDELDADFGGRSSTTSSLESHEGLVSIKVPDCPSLVISDYSTSPSPPPATPQSSHGSKVSLSRWVFPSGSATPTRAISNDTDNFFDIEDADNLPLGNTAEYDSQSLFTQSLRLDTFDEEDESSMPPFVIPAHVGVEVVKKPILGALMEEEEPVEEEPVSDFDEMELAGEEMDGIMRFTFTPNISVTVTPPTAHNTPDSSYRRQKSLSKMPIKKRTESSDTSVFQDEDVDMSFSRRSSTAVKPIITVTKPSASSIPRSNVPKPPVKRSTVPSMIPKVSSPAPPTTRTASKIPTTSRLPQRPSSASPTPRSPQRAQTMPHSPKPVTPSVPTPTRISSPSSSSASSSSTVTGKVATKVNRRPEQPKSPSVLDSIFGWSPTTKSVTKPGFVSRETQLYKLHKKLCSSDAHTLNPKGGIDACSKCRGKQVTTI